MGTLRFCACLLVLMFGSTGPVWAQIDVTDVRFWKAPHRLRVVIELSDRAKYDVFSLSNPERVVLDLQDTHLKVSLPRVRSMESVINAVRAGNPTANVLRLVFDLDAPVSSRVFTVPSGGGHSDRVILDLYPNIISKNESKSLTQEVKKVPSGYLVVIDAGHGGEDPGALGYRGVREKEIVLSVARRLKALIDQEPEMHSVLTRKGDYYLGLRRRVDIARNSEASVFVSIHADAFSSSNARGGSVYSLSERGATSEMAAYLAQRENAADLAGGVSLSDIDRDLAEVLLDMQLDWKIEESRLLGASVLRELGTVGPLHSRRVEQAGFVVLKAPSIPSILVEVGYVTNPKDVKRLQSPNYQQHLAAAIYRGILFYCYSRPGCPLAEKMNRIHVVKLGDSLSGIAELFNCNIDAIKQVNGLDTDVIQLGQRLIIPEPTR